MAQRLVIGAATLLALVSMTACSGPDAGDPLAETSEGTASPTPTPTDDVDPEETAGPSPTNAGKDGEDGFVYLPWGPDDAPIPQQYQYLAASGSQPPRCADLADAKPAGAFWETALAVCRAIVEGTDWPATTTVPAPPPAANGYEACLDAELAEMLERALRWHADNPGRRPLVDYPSRTSTSPCQARIYEVRVLTDADREAYEDFPEGVPLAITATALETNPPVTIGGQRVAEGGPNQNGYFTWAFNVDEFPDTALRTIVVLAPPAEQPRTATIAVSTSRGPIEATVDLPGSAPSPPTTDVVTPTQTDPTTESPTPAPDE